MLIVLATESNDRNLCHRIGDNHAVYIAYVANFYIFIGTSNK